MVQRVKAKQKAEELIIRIGEKRKLVREAIGGILFTVQSMLERTNLSGMQGASLDIVKPEPSPDLILQLSQLFMLLERKFVLAMDTKA